MDELKKTGNIEIDAAAISAIEPEPAPAADEDTLSGQKQSEDVSAEQAQSEQPEAEVQDETVPEKKTVTVKKIRKTKRLSRLGVRLLAVACLLAGIGIGVGSTAYFSGKAKSALIEEYEARITTLSQQTENVREESYDQGFADGAKEERVKIEAERLAEEKAKKETEEKSDGEESTGTTELRTAPAENNTHEPESTAEPAEEDTSWNETSSTWTGTKLSAANGAIQGPSGKETYYNLDMSGVVSNARNAGVSGDYWVRDDGAKMMGDYVIAACDVTGAVHNRYDIVSTSLGQAICLDTGGFAASNPYQIDIATTW